MSTTATVSARERINSLLDDNSFVETGALVTARNTDFNLNAQDTPADGVVTGYGVINDNLVYVYSQDASVLNGSMGEMHAKKICEVYDMAMKVGAPVIGLIDCAGLRLQEATDALNAFGNIYFKQSMASGVIPQITAVFGQCGGGLSVLTAMSDFTFMDEKNAKLFVNSPNAIDKNFEGKLDTAAADFQAEAGNVDYKGSEEDVLTQIRALVSILPANNEDDDSYDECTDDLNRVCSDLASCNEDTAIALAKISDDQFFFETKKDFAKDMVTGFIRLNGVTVGAVANRSKVYDDDMKVTDEFDGRLSVSGAKKAAQFVEFCDAFEIPVLTLTNVNGFAASTCNEKHLAKQAAKLAYAFANSTVPKVNVIVGNAFGSAYTIMNSKALGADVTFAWPDAKVGMMDASLAAGIICADHPEDIADTTAKYAELQDSVTSAARRGYVDTIIQPEDTRKYVIGAFEMLFTKREDRPGKKHGTI